jgi:low affinity Fe/Cu permease
VSEKAQRPPNLLSRQFALAAGAVAGVTGHPITFMLSCAIAVVWVVASFVFHLAETWQTLISIAITMTTFLMVFLIQSTQKSDSTAIQAKLDELIRAVESAKNKFIGIESRTIKEVHELRQETVEEAKLLEELVGEVGEGRAQFERARAPLSPTRRQPPTGS